MRKAPGAPRTNDAGLTIDLQQRDVPRHRVYRDLMGWEIKNDNGKSQCTLKIGDGVDEIIIRNRREPAADAPAQAGRAPLTGVINHVSYGIAPWNTDAVKAELDRRGLKPRPDMVGTDFKSYHVTDPDGWDLQISNQTKASRAESAGSILAVTFDSRASR